MTVLTPVDAAQVLATIHAAFAVQSARTDPPSGALQETLASIEAQLTIGGGAGVRAGTGLAAVVLWREKENGLYLGRLAVHPRYRRRGLARTLLAAAEAEARRRNLPRLHLGTRLALAETSALFTSCGFVATGLETHPGYPAPTSVAMEKWLTGG